MSTENDIDFEAAFAEAMGEDLSQTDVEAGTDAAAPDTTTGDQVEPDRSESAQVEPEASATDGSGADTPDDKAPAAAPNTATDKPADAPAAPASVPAPMSTQELAAAIAEASAIAAKQQQQKQEPAAPQERDATFEDYLDETQKKALEQFNAEWSDVASPVTALIQAHVQAALVNQQKQILGQVQQQMAPIQQHAAQSQEALYWGTIQAAHPDFREAAEAIPGWIETQPKLYQPRLMEIYNAGSAADVVELISMYKQAVGSTGAAPAHPASSAVQAAPKPAPVAPEALAATLAPPAAKRSSVKTSRDPNDAEAAFNEAFAS